MTSRFIDGKRVRTVSPYHLEALSMLPSPPTDIFDTPSLLPGYENRPLDNAGEYHRTILPSVNLNQFCLNRFWQLGVA